MENGTNEQIVSHLEKELALKGLEAPDEIQINTVTQQALQQNSEKPKSMYHHCKNQVTIELSAVNSNEKKTKSEVTRIVPKIIRITLVVLKQTPTPTIKFQRIPKRTIYLFEETDLDQSSHPVRPVVELTTPQRNITLEQMHLTDRLLGIDGRKHKKPSPTEKGSE